MKSSIRPILMILFVFFMIFLMNKYIAQKEDLQKQENLIDENSVIYSDIGVEGTDEKTSLNDHSSSADK